MSTSLRGKSIGETEENVPLVVLGIPHLTTALRVVGQVGCGCGCGAAVAQIGA